MDSKTAFFETLKLEFASRLREVGFRGSGQNFRRLHGDVINAINIQRERYGRECAVNVGLHLTFLPIRSQSDELPNPNTIKEIDCEFRSRVAPDGAHDFWWEYGTTAESAQRSARHLIATYFAGGEVRFQRFTTVESITHMCPIEFLKSEPPVFKSDLLFGPITISRMALAMARIHEHIGNRTLAKQFAEAGLANVGNAKALISRFQKIIDTNS